ncbi:hypothetical protein, partial [Enterococcus gallinarum]
RNNQPSKKRNVRLWAFIRRQSSETYFIERCQWSNGKSISNHIFWLLVVLILNLVLNLWTDLFSPFFVLAQKLASQSTRINDL